MVSTMDLSVKQEGEPRGQCGSLAAEQEPVMQMECILNMSRDEFISALLMFISKKDVLHFHYEEEARKRYRGNAPR